MPTNRSYVVDSGNIAVAVSTQTPILMAATGSVVTVNIVAARVWVTPASGAVFPSNASVAWEFARAANTPAGGTSVTPTINRVGIIAAQSAWTIGSWSTAPTAPSPTAGGMLWAFGTALAAGADWGEWVNAGSEKEIGNSAWAAMFVTCSSAPTNVNFRCQIEFAE